MLVGEVDLGELLAEGLDIGIDLALERGFGAQGAGALEGGEGALELAEALVKHRKMRKDSRIAGELFAGIAQSLFGFDEIALLEVHPSEAIHIRRIIRLDLEGFSDKAFCLKQGLALFCEQVAEKIQGGGVVGAFFEDLAQDAFTIGEALLFEVEVAEVHQGAFVFFPYGEAFFEGEDLCIEVVGMGAFNKRLREAKPSFGRESGLVAQAVKERASIFVTSDLCEDLDLVGIDLMPCIGVLGIEALEKRERLLG